MCSVLGLSFMLCCVLLCIISIMCKIVHITGRMGLRVAAPPLPQYVFMVWYLFKHEDNFTFTFITERSPYSEANSP